MMGLIKGMGVTLKTMTKKKVTHKYPDEPIPMPDRFRGIQHLDPDQCIVCNQCARVCPTDCISLTGHKHPEKRGKVLDTFDINFEICILCDLCTEVCPTEAIVMTHQFELASYSRDDLYKNLEWLHQNNSGIRSENNVNARGVKKK
ncbi:NADH-quinone oxidoreductase subunit I [Melghirimyces thermohalophilus]|mgnify:FL=1|uniref:NADH-quinone oxidoreductase subunit I n=1 Tax=Melghirimyces thermohalophilus TaxID=1236220 RepID=A0A1G6MCF1_9BACL|nr:NADH-quinone oxidoreductase subunit NuoI [Melghirimyces thermohalophilus]SDC53189.1 NADH-quinone oxidoreductase subunit I [Melghirimyces thermohalophilus]